MANDDFISIEVKGLEKLITAFNRFPGEIARAMSKAGQEAGEEVVKTRGLRSYPGATAANRPPTPYYKRGYGVQYKSYLKHTSENLGKKWVVKSQGWNTKIGNVASYAKYVHGDEQAHWMKEIGWIKLDEAVDKKMPKIRRIYQNAVKYLIRKLDL